MGKFVDYVFCLPGSPSSSMQSLNLMAAMQSISQAGNQIGIRSAKSCNIYCARNGCIGNAELGFRKDQKPFEGLYDDYKKMIWVDSDNIVNADQIKKLLSHDVDIVAGWYRQYSSGAIDDTNKAACGREKALLMGEIPKLKRNERGLIEVEYAGFGLMVIKKGVFEALGFPWFRSWVEEREENGVQLAELITDDGGFCMNAKKLGYHIYIDPDVRVGHEKMAVL